MAIDNANVGAVTASTGTNPFQDAQQSTVPRSTLTAPEVVELGRALLELATSADASDTPRPGGRRPFGMRMRRIAIGAGKVVGETLFVMGRVQEQLPDNWVTALNFPRLQSLIADGFPVLWVPTMDVMAEMTAAVGRPARQDVLLRRHDEVLKHARSILSDITAADLAFDREILEQAVSCAVTYPYVAQLAALMVGSTRAQAELQTSRLGDLARQCETAKKANLVDSVEDLGTWLMLLAIGPVLDRFRPESGDAVPTRPNRHAVAHLVSDQQYTPGNALESVLLGVSVLRQAETRRRASVVLGPDVDSADLRGSSRPPT